MLLIYYVLLVVVLAAVLFLLAPTPKTPQTKVAQLEIPDSELGIAIPVLFGTRQIKSPFLAWYGNVRIVMVEIPT